MAGFLWGEDGHSAIVITTTTTTWTSGAKGPRSPSPQVRMATLGPLFSAIDCGVFWALQVGPRGMFRGDLGGLARRGRALGCLEDLGASVDFPMPLENGTQVGCV